MRPAAGGLWQDATHSEVIVMISHLSLVTLDTTHLLPTILSWTGRFVLVGGAKLAKYRIQISDGKSWEKAKMPAPD